MVGLVLNEEGYVTYPYDIFIHIEDYVKSLNWRITNVECGGDDTDYIFPFVQCEDNFIDGDSLFEKIKDHPRIQWWWGTISGFPKDVLWEDIKKNPVIDLTVEQPYLKNKLHHLEPKAVFELIAFDSTETYVLIDDPTIAACIRLAFPKSENLDKYVFDNGI